MPAVSKSQFKLMAGVCNGSYPDGYKGISKKVACEFVNKTPSTKGLPMRTRPKTEAERAATHKRLFGTTKLPKRGTGRQRFISMLKGR